MIYRKNSDKISIGNELPDNVRMCIEHYQQAMDSFSFNDYKMRLNEKTMDEKGVHNLAFRKANDARNDASMDMRQSLRAAFVYAKNAIQEEQQPSYDLIDETANAFQDVVTSSVYYGSEAPMCNSHTNTPVEELFRIEISNQKNKAILELGSSIENKEDSIAI